MDTQADGNGQVFFRSLALAASAALLASVGVAFAHEPAGSPHAHDYIAEVGPREWPPSINLLYAGDADGLKLFIDDLVQARGRLGSSRTISAPFAKIMKKDTPAAEKPVLAGKLVEQLARENIFAIASLSEGKWRIDGGANSKVLLLPGRTAAIIVLVRNDSDKDISLSLKAEGKGVKVAAAHPGKLARGRWGCYLLGVESEKSGKATIDLTIGAENGPQATTSIPLTVRPSGVLSVKFIDKETGKPVTANCRVQAGPTRLFLPETLKRYWFPFILGSRGDWRGVKGRRGAEYAREFKMSVPAGKVVVSAQRGIQHTPVSIAVEVQAGKTVEKTIEIGRWTKIRERGWITCEGHAHPYIGTWGYADITPQRLMKIMEGDAIDYMPAAGLGGAGRKRPYMRRVFPETNGAWPFYMTKHFTGKPLDVSTPDRILTVTFERQGSYGHIIAFGIRRVPKLYMFNHAPEAGSDICQDVLSAGGIPCYAHGMGQSGKRPFERDGNLQARDIVQSAALDKVHHMEVAASGDGDGSMTREHWYHLLNCGLRIYALGGSDSFINEGYALGGRNLFYAYVGENFTYESFLEATRKGATFAVETGAPLIFCRFNDKLPGTEFSTFGEYKVSVEAVTRSQPIHDVEILRNGKVVYSARKEGLAGKTSLKIDKVLKIDSACWLMVRGTIERRHSKGSYRLYSHSSPVFIEPKNHFIREKTSLEFAREWLDKLEALRKRRMSSKATKAQRLRHRQQFAAARKELNRRLDQAQKP